MTSEGAHQDSNPGQFVIPRPYGCSVPRRSRHPKKDIEAALRAGARTCRKGGSAVIHSFAVVIDGVDLTGPDSPHADALYEAGATMPC